MPQNITDTGRRAHSIAETCALTGLGRDTVYAAIRDGHLVARKLGRRTLITDDDLRQFLVGLPRAGGHEQVAVRSPEAADEYRRQLEAEAATKTAAAA
jgi:excisionase family DNA binding protein